MTLSKFSKFLIGGVSATALMLPSTVAFAQLNDEIIVTAEKREESVQDVSLSVSAFDEETLSRAGIQDVSRLELVVPGVNYAFAGNDAKFNVRGANSTNTFGDNSSIVGAFLDGVYKARSSQQTRGFYDVKSVEFLRGPQGTLYGRNTFAGALNVYTNTPDLDDYSAGIEASYQRFDRIRGEGFVNIPMGENAALRVAAYYDKSDGHIKNLAGPDIGAQDDKGFRVTGLWAPTDDLEVIARYQYSGEDGNEAGLFGYTFLCRNVTPDGLTDAFGSERDCVNPIRGSGGLGTAANGPGGDPWVIAQDYIQPVDLVDHNATLEVNYDFGSVTMKSITNYNKFENDIGFDFDFGPNPVQNGGYDEESKGWSQEFQFNSDYDSPLQWTGGFYYSDLEDRSTFYIYDQTQRRPNSDRPTVVTPQFPMGVQLLTATGIVSRDRILNNFFANNVIIDTEYFGIYGQAEYSVSDQLRIIGGLRYNDETKAASCGGSNFSGGDRVVNVAPGVAGSSPLFLPNNAQDVFTYNCDAADAVTSATVSDFPGDYDNVTWRAGVEYDMSDDVLLYGTASTGYLSGSASTASTTEQQTSRVFEAGFKSRLADNTLQLNGAVHFTEYTNLLTQRQEINAAGITDTFTDNGGDIEAWGIELEAQWQPTEALFLTATAAYLDSEFVTFGQGNPYQLYQGQIVDFIDQAGTTTPWSPDLTLGATASYEIDLGDKGTLTPHGQFYYSDGYNTSNLLANDPSHFQESFTKTDLRLIWDAPSEDYSIEIFVENIENSAVLARGNNNSDDIVQTSYLYPRNQGIKFKAKF
ncbi:MAG: TonB-dependent receptor [Hyphomonadaceae bacterium]|nr:TonB-dependent receptor [Hyphomonadaceae bacterium]